jgi:hypothetical protein
MAESRNFALGYAASIAMHVMVSAALFVVD